MVNEIKEYFDNYTDKVASAMNDRRQIHVYPVLFEQGFAGYSLEL